MFEKIDKRGASILVSDDHFEVEVTPKIYDDGYTELFKTSIRE